MRKSRMDYIEKGCKFPEISISWCWWRLFRKDWYTGDRLKFCPAFKDEYKILWDFGALTIAVYNKNYKDWTY